MEECKHYEAHERDFNSIRTDVKTKVNWTVFTWAIGILTAIIMFMGNTMSDLSRSANGRDVEMAKIQTKLVNIEALLVDIKSDLKNHDQQ